MWTSDFSNGDAAIDASLDRLGVEYIDLMILHHSQPSNDVDAYQAMERAVADGAGSRSVAEEIHRPCSMMRQSAEEMAQMTALERDERFADY